MKKTVFRKIIAAAAACMMFAAVWPAVPAAADGEPVFPLSGDCGAEGDNVTWTLDSDGTLTFSGTGKMENWYLSQVTYKSTVPYVDYLQDVQTVIIEDGVTSVGQFAFFDCTNLTEVTIPDSVTEIGMRAFWNCTNLTKVTIPDSVTAIEMLAFWNCENLAEIIIPESVTDIGSGAFNQTAWMESRLAESPFLIVNQILLYVRTEMPEVTVPDGVAVIAEQAIDGCRETLKSVTLPEGVKVIGQYGFAHCPALERVVLPESLTDIGTSAFNGCSSLQEINIPDGVTSIAAYTFSHCKKLESIDLPASVESIGAEAFHQCESLARITIRNPDCVIHEIFANGATISNSVKHVGSTESKHIFDGTIISYGGSAVEAYAEEYGRDFFDLGAVEIASGECGAEGDNVTWSLDSKGVLKITGEGEMGSWPPDQITYQSTVPYADYLEEIKKVVIKDGVTSIGLRAFYGCTNLNRIMIPESVTSFGQDAFSGTAWLEEKMNESLFLIINNVLVYARTIACDVTVPDGVTRIEAFAYSGNRFLTTVSVPETVKSIGAYAFSGCPNLVTVQIPKYYIQEIDAGAFSQCEKLKEINIPASLTEIKERTFFRCSSLESVTLPENIAEIGAEAFAECEQLSEITILNPDCVIFDEAAGAATISNRFAYVPDSENVYIFDGTIYGAGGSAVEAYAEKYGRNFVDISAPPAEEKAGDVNCDGTVDVSDAVILARLLAEDTEVVVKRVGMKNADVNNTGMPDHEDIVMILKAIARLITL